jgi:plastocyanin
MLELCTKESHVKRSYTFIALAVLMVALAAPVPSFAAPPPPAPQTYTVLVGLENSQQGIDVMAFFPSAVTIHAGDTVHWQINSNEIHTVSFGYLLNTTLPEAIIPAEPLYPADPSPLIVNPEVANPVIPAGEYVGGPANSGIMGREEGTVQEFDLTFSEPGDYLYVCLIHGWEMSGTVSVKPLGERVPSPQQSTAQGNQEMAQALASVPAVRKAAEEQIIPPVENPDGTMTHTILLGYHQGQIDLLRFFPDKTIVHPGDTVVWMMSETNDAPHTVTFLNGAPAPGLFVAVPQPSGPPLLYVDPGTLYPSPFPPQPDTELTRSGFYNSGLMLPIPGTSHSLIIGDVTPGPEPYLCLLHDESGMKGTLIILPK